MIIQVDSVFLQKEICTAIFLKILHCTRYSRWYSGYNDTITAPVLVEFIVKLGKTDYDNKQT